MNKFTESQYQSSFIIARLENNQNNLDFDLKAYQFYVSLKIMILDIPNLPFNKKSKDNIHKQLTQLLLDTFNYNQIKEFNLFTADHSNYQKSLGEYHA